MATETGTPPTIEAYNEAVNKAKKFECILQHICEDYIDLKIKFEEQNQQLAEQKLQLDKLIDQKSTQNAQMMKIIDQNTELFLKLNSEDWRKKKKQPLKTILQGCEEPPKIDLDGIIESNWEEVVDNFVDMNLKEELLRGIYFNGLETPSAIQQKAIIPCVQGHDVIVQAESDTERIVAFSISILQQIDTSVPECQALILTRTSELAQQIQKVIIGLSNFLLVECHVCVGINVKEDKKILEKGVQVVVGIYGRIRQMMKRKALRLDNIKIFVLEEADKMLSNRSKKRSVDIFKALNDDVQVIISSATLPPIATLLEFNRKFKLISVTSSAQLE